ncbi:hypothetical protein LIER_00710 [Lithospermum erythrorhizon]|uniref:Uncharacterized protein n=1 Tax=Lithospermum erythrorhizon TaxID=34254 RepID=A0AAV3NIA9_LITER
MNGKRLPRFSSQLVVRKPLTSGAAPIPIFHQKRSSIEASASVSKKVKIEALVAIPAPSSSPKTTHPEVISLEDELPTSVEEASGAKNGKEKSKAPAFVRSSQAILPLLAKTGASSKKGKGKAVSSGVEPSLDCYTSRYMKAHIPSPMERDEELNSCKEVLSAEEVKCQQLQEKKQATKLEHVNRCITLEADLEKLKRDQSTLAKDVEDSRSTTVAVTKRDEDAKTRAKNTEARLSQVDDEVARQVAEFKDSEEVISSWLWYAEYFEGLSVEGGEGAAKEVVIDDDDDEATP